MNSTDSLPFDPSTLHDIAREWGTPCYVYHEETLIRGWNEFVQALEDSPHRLCYAVKANSSLAILQLFARMGAGFDIVSAGELERVLKAGGDPARVVFSGVGKTVEEIRRALRLGIACFNVESASELRRISRIAAEENLRAPVSLRVNPDVDACTHPYISTGLRSSKFGIAWEEAPDLYREAAANHHLRVTGIDCHIGSQLTEVAPFIDALKRVLELVDLLAAEGIVFDHLDMGGGLGIRYRDETPPSIADYVAAIRTALDGRGLELWLEPGKVLVGNAGVLLTRVEYLKPGVEHNFAIVDAAMNDLMRPALYEAWHDMISLEDDRGLALQRWDVVGPVCESGDFLAKDRELALEEGDLLAVCSAGAYGMSMSSNYNTRPRAAEVLHTRNGSVLIRRRETVADLLENEYLLD